MLSPDDLRCKYPESNPANIHVRAWYLACRQPREPHVQLPRSIKIDGKMTTRVVRCKDMNPLLTIVRNLLALGFTPTPEAEQSSLMHAAFHDFHTYENRYQWGSILKGQLLADLFPERELDTELETGIRICVISSVLLLARRTSSKIQLFCCSIRKRKSHAKGGSDPSS